LKNRFLNKLKSRAGETLVETLFAILIATFASVLLATSTSTAIEMNRQARARDKATQQCLKSLSTEVGVEVVENATVKIQQMEIDEETGDLVKKTAGDSEVAAQNIRVNYTGCKLEGDVFGDFSTYQLRVVSAGS